MGSQAPREAILANLFLVCDCWLVGSSFGLGAVIGRTNFICQIGSCSLRWEVDLDRQGRKGFRNRVSVAYRLWQAQIFPRQRSYLCRLSVHGYWRCLCANMFLGKFVWLLYVWLPYVWWNLWNSIGRYAGHEDYETDSVSVIFLVAFLSFFHLRIKDKCACTFSKPAQTRCFVQNRLATKWKRRVLQKIPGQLKASFQIFLTLRSKQSNTNTPAKERCGFKKVQAILFVGCRSWECDNSAPKITLWNAEVARLTRGGVGGTGESVNQIQHNQRASVTNWTINLLLCSTFLAFPQPHSAIVDYCFSFKLYIAFSSLSGGLGSKSKIVEFWCPTWSLCLGFRPGKHFSNERGLPFYYLKIEFLGFLEYLRISGEIQYPKGPIGCRKKLTVQKKACVVHVGAVIHDYQGERASWPRKCHAWKDCPGDLTSLNRYCQLLNAESPVPAQGVSAIRPGPVFFWKENVCFPPLSFCLFPSFPAQVCFARYCISLTSLTITSIWHHKPLRCAKTSSLRAPEFYVSEPSVLLKTWSRNIRFIMDEMYTIPVCTRCRPWCLSVFGRLLRAWRGFSPGIEPRTSWPKSS